MALAAQDIFRRVETNLRELAGAPTPFGKVFFAGDAPYVKKAASPPAISCQASLIKGIVIRKETLLQMDFVSLEASAPASLAGLREVIEEREAGVRSRLGFHLLPGLYNPGGWTEDALGYIRNDPPGSGFSHPALHVVLIGPAATDVVFDAGDKLLVSLRSVFCGRTHEEDVAIAGAALSRAVLVAGYVPLNKVSADIGIDGKIVMEAARRRATEEGLRLEKVRGAGYVLRRKA